MQLCQQSVGCAHRRVAVGKPFESSIPMAVCMLSASTGGRQECHWELSVRIFPTLSSLTQASTQALTLFAFVCGLHCPGELNSLALEAWFLIKLLSCSTIPFCNDSFAVIVSKESFPSLNPKHKALPSVKACSSIISFLLHPNTEHDKFFYPSLSWRISLTQLPWVCCFVLVSLLWLAKDYTVLLSFL